MADARSRGVFGSSGASGDSNRAYGNDGRSSGHRLQTGENDPGDGASKLLDASQCRAKMLKLLSARDYSVKMMRERLAHAGFSQEDIGLAVSSAVDSRLLDDVRYAEFYITSRIGFGWGRARIERELRKQGVDPVQVPGYPEAFFASDDELERARGLLRRHRTSAKDARAAHYRFLMSKGFDHATCMKALAEEGL